MPRRLLPVACLVMALLGWRPAAVQPQPTTPQASPHRPAYKSPLGVAVDQDGGRAYVALHTADAVAVVDLRAGKVLREVAVGKGPYDLALSGGNLFVTCEQGDTLVRVDLARQAVSGRWPVGPAPRGVTVLPDGARVFVACHDDRTLRALDVATGKVSSVQLSGWPDRLALHRDAEDSYVLVLSARPGEAVVSLTDSAFPPRLLHTSRLADVTNARGLTSSQGLSPRVLVIHQKPRTNLPATQVAQGWVFTNGVSTRCPRGAAAPW
jgi:YVTN family beta-propeller protein